MRYVIDKFPTVLVITAVLLVGSVALADDQVKARPRAPADYQIVSSDRAGAYFIARPLKDRYDKLVAQLATLRRDIAQARITSHEARNRVDALSTELQALKQQIEEAKIYIPGASVHNATTTEAFPIAAEDFLLIDASDVELRGSDKPEVRVVVEKSVLSVDDKGIDDDLAGIRVIHRKASGKELFGFYKDIAGKPEWKNDWERFQFKEYLDREFSYIKIVGLAHQEGNRQITVDVKNEQGGGEMSSQWRRHARLVVYAPRCGHIGVRGGLAGFRITRVNAPVTVAGEGDRDYEASYEVSKLTGSLSAANIAINRLDGVKGDVSIVATAYAGNTSTVHDDRGITMEPGPMPSADYQNIDGNLRVRFVRTDLTIGRVSGRIDVENDFGKTTWLANAPLGKHDHRIVSQDGPIEVRIGKSARGDLPLALYSECGIVHLAPGMKEGLEDSSFSSSFGDDVYRSWHGFVTTGSQCTRLRALRTRSRRAPRPTAQARSGHHQPRRGDSLTSGSALRHARHMRSPAGTRAILSGNSNDALMRSILKGSVSDVSVTEIAGSVFAICDREPPNPSRRIPIMRRLPTILVVGAVTMALVSLAPVLIPAVRADGTGQVSLMQTLAEWKYPDSKMLGGASMSDGGDRLVQSVKCRAVLTTPDPIEKVVDFYSKKLATPPDVILPSTKAEDLVPDGKSVSIQDDSQGRTVALRVIVVHKANASTTLVISRANDEKETHIAWLHYIRFGEKR